MKIPDFYERRWNKIGVVGIKCKDNDSDYLDYIRKEYEVWALWIDRFYDGEHGIYKIGGDAPRYALEDHLDFCFWDKTYKKNYKKRDHLSNHTKRSHYIINLLTKLFEEVNNFVDYDVDDDKIRDKIRTMFDPLSLKEMKEKIMTDPEYKQKWFQAAHDANKYISSKFLSKKKTKTKSNKKTKKSNYNKKSK